MVRDDRIQQHGSIEAMTDHRKVKGVKKQPSKSGKSVDETGARIKKGISSYMSKADISRQISIDAKVDKPTTARIAKNKDNKGGASKTPLGSHYKNYQQHNKTPAPGGNTIDAS